MKFRIAAIATVSLGLAACGSADDASTEAEADTVEIAADEAMEPVTDEPVADPNANVVADDAQAEAAAEVEAASVETAGDNAAATAEAAMDAMAEESAE
jgi:hypothetical protein